jgi:hypothetical protein
VGSTGHALRVGQVHLAAEGVDVVLPAAAAACAGLLRRRLPRQHLPCAAARMHALRCALRTLTRVMALLRICVLQIGVGIKREGHVVCC